MHTDTINEAPVDTADVAGMSFSEALKFILYLDYGIFFFQNSSYNNK